MKKLIVLIFLISIVGCQKIASPTPTETLASPTAVSTAVSTPTATEIPDETIILVSQSSETTILDAVIAPDNSRYVVLFANQDQMEIALYSFETPDSPLATAAAKLSNIRYLDLPKTHILHFAPDGKTLFALLEDSQTLQIWDAETLAPITSWELPETAEIIVVNHAGNQIASAGMEISPVYLLSYPEGKLIQTLELPSAQHDEKIAMMINLFRAVSYSPDDSLLIANTPYVLYQWDLNTSIGTVLLENSNNQYSSAIYPTQKGIYLYKSNNTTLYQFERATNTLEKVALPPSISLGTTVAISPYAQLATTSELTPGVFMVNLMNDASDLLAYQLSNTEKVPLPFSISLFFSDDGSMLLGIFANHDLRIWALKSNLRPPQ